MSIYIGLIIAGAAGLLDSRVGWIVILVVGVVGLIR
jgi:hypothetical protein